VKRDVRALQDRAFDLLILGGGITGAGVALDAALRGLRVALIDKGDFASGTSSASSKLVHGGLRYLEHGDIRLVYEAMQERRRLLRNAPHQVRPLRFVLPFYRGVRVPPWKWRLGLTLYDLLAGSDNLSRSRPHPVAQLRREFPCLRPSGLIGGASYYDAQMDDARLCIDVLRTAALSGARVANYVEAVAFLRTGEFIRGVRAVDHLSGEEIGITARVVVNATGPWGDAVRRLAGEETPPLMRPTKGVHLVAPDRGLHAAFLLLHPCDGRVFFVIPWLGKTLLGTTDTECDESPDAVRVTDADVSYLLDGHNHFFDPPLSAADLLGSFVGLRPLLRTAPNDPSARTREFRLVASPSGLLTVAGGKYTTFRQMAEVITDAVVRRLGFRRRCRTRDCRLDGAPDELWDAFAKGGRRRLETVYGLDEFAAQHLLERYGRRAEDVAHFIGRDAQLGRRVVPEESDLLAEFVYQREYEMAVRPADFLLRRTRLGLFHPSLLARPPVEVAQGRARET
jgi:glycerol-3-phosphate dehydrogenase